MNGGLAPGWRIGHYSDEAARTGCTVLLPPPGTVASCDIRGSSPSSRELALLHIDRRLTEVHAILLTGGSAFGLAAADGVVTWLEARGLGYRTALGPVPIVPAAVIFDLGEGRPDVRPGATAGRAACDAAREGDPATGRVGAATGATVGKWAGPEHASPGGLGIAARSARGLRVGALAVVNAVGDVVDENGSVLRGTTAPGARSPEGRMTRHRAPADSEDEASEVAEIPPSTVLAVVAADARLDKRDARWLAARGADGITVSVRPAHTRYDGDVVFAAARLGAAGGAALDVLGELATEAVAAAVRAAVA
jgi:L-aminopeptidase/D-esterase-like protein